MVLAILLQTLLVLCSSLLLQTIQGCSGLTLLWKTSSKGLSEGFALKTPLSEAAMGTVCSQEMLHCLRVCPVEEMQNCL